jgi:hypothetical protein
MKLQEATMSAVSQLFSYNFSVILVLMFAQNSLKPQAAEGLGHLKNSALSLWLPPNYGAVERGH